MGLTFLQCLGNLFLTPAWVFWHTCSGWASNSTSCAGRSTHQWWSCTTCTARWRAQKMTCHLCPQAFRLCQTKCTSKGERREKQMWKRRYRKLHSPIYTHIYICKRIHRRLFFAVKLQLSQRWYVYGIVPHSQHRKKDDNNITAEYHQENSFSAEPILTCEYSAKQQIVFVDRIIIGERA